MASEENEAWWALLGWPHAARHRVEDRMRVASTGCPRANASPAEQVAMTKVLRNRLAEQEARTQVVSFGMLLQEAEEDPDFFAVALEQVGSWEHARRWLAGEWELLKRDPADPLSRALGAFLPGDPGLGGAGTQHGARQTAPEGGAHRREPSVPFVAGDPARPVPAAALLLSLWLVAAFDFGTAPYRRRRRHAPEQIGEEDPTEIMTHKAQAQGRRVMLGLLKFHSPKLTLAAAIIAATLTLTAQTGASALQEARRTALYVGAPAVSTPKAREAGVFARSYADSAPPRTLQALGFSPEAARERVIDTAMASVTEAPPDGTPPGVTTETALEAGATLLAQTEPHDSSDEGDPGASPDAEGEEIVDARPVRPDLGDGELAVIDNGAGTPQDSPGEDPEGDVPPREEPSAEDLPEEGPAHGDDASPQDDAPVRPPEQPSDEPSGQPGDDDEFVSVPPPQQQDEDPASADEPAPTTPPGQEPSVEGPPTQEPIAQRPIPDEGQDREEDFVLAPPQEEPGEPPSPVANPPAERPEVAEPETEPQTQEGREPREYPSAPQADPAPTDTTTAKNDAIGATPDPMTTARPPAREEDTTSFAPTTEPEQEPSPLDDAPTGETDGPQEAQEYEQQEEEDDYAILIPAPVGEDPSAGQTPANPDPLDEQPSPVAEPPSPTAPYPEPEQAMVPQQTGPAPTPKDVEQSDPTLGEPTEPATTPLAPHADPGDQTPASPQDPAAASAPEQGEDPPEDFVAVLPVDEDAAGHVAQQGMAPAADPPEAEPLVPAADDAPTTGVVPDGANPEDVLGADGVSGDGAPEPGDPLDTHTEPQPAQTEAVAPATPHEQEPPSYPDLVPAYPAGEDSPNEGPYPPEEEEPGEPLAPTPEQDDPLPEQPAPAIAGRPEDTAPPQQGGKEYAVLLPVPAEEEPLTQDSSTPAGADPPRQPAPPAENPEAPTYALNGREPTTTTTPNPLGGTEIAGSNGEPNGTATPPAVVRPTDEDTPPTPEQARPIPGQQAAQDAPGPPDVAAPQTPPDATSSNLASGTPEPATPAPPAEDADGGPDPGAPDPADVSTGDGISGEAVSDSRDLAYASEPLPPEPGSVEPQSPQSRPPQPEASHRPRQSFEEPAPYAAPEPEPIRGTREDPDAAEPPPDTRGEVGSQVDTPPHPSRAFVPVGGEQQSPATSEEFVHPSVPTDLEAQPPTTIPDASDPTDGATSGSVDFAEDATAAAPVPITGATGDQAVPPPTAPPPAAPPPATGETPIETFVPTQDGATPTTGQTSPAASSGGGAQPAHDPVAAAGVESVRPSAVPADPVGEAEPSALPVEDAIGPADDSTQAEDPTTQPGDAGDSAGGAPPASAVPIEHADPSGTTSPVPEVRPEQMPPYWTLSAPWEGPATPPVPDTQASLEAQQEADPITDPEPTTTTTAQDVAATDDPEQEPPMIASLGEDQQDPATVAQTVPEQQDSSVASETAPEQTPKQAPIVPEEGASLPTAMPDGPEPADAPISGAPQTTLADPAAGPDEAIGEQDATPEENGTPGIAGQVEPPEHAAAGTARTAGAPEEEQHPSEPPRPVDDSAPVEQTPPPSVASPVGPPTAEPVEPAEAAPVLEETPRKATGDEAPYVPTPVPSGQGEQPLGDASAQEGPAEGSTAGGSLATTPVSQDATTLPAEDYESPGWEISALPPAQGEEAEAAEQGAPLPAGAAPGSGDTADGTNHAVTPGDGTTPTGGFSASEDGTGGAAVVDDAPAATQGESAQPAATPFIAPGEEQTIVGPADATLGPHEYEPQAEGPITDPELAGQPGGSGEAPLASEVMPQNGEETAPPPASVAPGYDGEQEEPAQGPVAAPPGTTPESPEGLSKGTGTTAGDPAPEPDAVEPAPDAPEPLQNENTDASVARDASAAPVVDGFGAAPLPDESVPPPAPVDEVTGSAQASTSVPSEPADDTSEPSTVLSTGAQQPQTMAGATEDVDQQQSASTYAGTEPNADPDLSDATLAAHEEEPTGQAVGQHLDTPDVTESDDDPGVNAASGSPMAADGSAGGQGVDEPADPSRSPGPVTDPTGSTGYERSGAGDTPAVAAEGVVDAPLEQTVVSSEEADDRSTTASREDDLLASVHPATGGQTRQATLPAAQDAAPATTPRVTDDPGSEEESAPEPQDLAEPASEPGVPEGDFAAGDAGALAVEAGPEADATPDVEEEDFVPETGTDKPEPAAPEPSTESPVPPTGTPDETVATDAPAPATESLPQTDPEDAAVNTEVGRSARDGHDVTENEAYRKQILEPATQPVEPASSETEPTTAEPPAESRPVRLETRPSEALTDTTTGDTDAAITTPDASREGVSDPTFVGQEQQQEQDAFVPKQEEDAVATEEAGRGPSASVQEGAAASEDTPDGKATDAEAVRPNKEAPEAQPAEPWAAGEQPPAAQPVAAPTREPAASEPPPPSDTPAAAPELDTPEPEPTAPKPEPVATDTPDVDDREPEQSSQVLTRAAGEPPPEPEEADGADLASGTDGVADPTAVPGDPAWKGGEA